MSHNLHATNWAIHNLIHNQLGGVQITDFGWLPQDLFRQVDCVGVGGDLDFEIS